LSWAVFQSDIEAARILLHSGADPDFTPPDNDVKFPSFDKPLVRVNWQLRFASKEEKPVLLEIKKLLTTAIKAEQQSWWHRLIAKLKGDTTL
jgi:hypothetical protein